MLVRSVARRVTVLVAVLALAASLSACGPAPARDQSCGPVVPGFVHRNADLGAVRWHYVIGGSGPPVVLLHGFPETWVAWRGVMSALEREHTVIAVDLPGLGCSAARTARYDKQSLARDVHQLVAALGLVRVSVVGHDMGAMVAYAYARTYRGQTSHLVLSGAVLPGFGLDQLIHPPPGTRGLPHLRWFMTRPEQARKVIDQDERTFLAHFIGTPEVVASPAFEEYVRGYAQPHRLAAALRLYRSLPEDAQDNRRHAAPALAMPVLVLNGEFAAPERSARSVARVARSMQMEMIPGAGHYAHEQNSAAFGSTLRRFLR